VSNTTSSSTELLTVKIDTDITDGLKEAKRFQKTLSVNMKKVQESVGKAGKGFVSFNKQLSAARVRSKGLRELTAQFKALDKVVKDRDDLFRSERKNIKGMKHGSPERKEAMKRLNELKKTTGYTEARALRKGAAKSMKDLRPHAEADRGVLRKQRGKEEESASKEMLRNAEESGEKYASAFRDALNKDAPALMRRMAKTFMMAGSTESKVKARSISMKGSAISKAGSERMEKGGIKNIVAGGASKAGGELMKVFGGLGKIIADLGPMIGLLSSFMMAFIKIMIDAESAAKEYNKAILATSGTGSYLRRNFGDASKATKDLGKSLEAARDGAKAWSNISWGISGEMARSFQSAITAEGVALDRLGTATGEATVSHEQHAKTIKMGVAYSRAFGVSLSEVAQLQGQLMADLGLGAESVASSFQMIEDGAANAGMESNKFFGIVRSFSSDLSLFTLRLSDVTKIMGMLGKTMDPRKMGQFLQTLNQKFQGGITDNLKFNFLAGPKGQQIQKDDAADKLKNLADDLREKLGAGKEDAIQELIAMLKNPKTNPRAIAEWTVAQGVQSQGDLTKSIYDNANIQKRLASGSRIDQAAVLDSLSPLAKMETLEAAAVNLTGHGFDELSDLSLAAVEASGIASAKEIQMYQALRQGIMTGQAELTARFAKNDKNALKEGDLEQVARMGIDVANKTNAQIAEEIKAKFEDPAGLKLFMSSLTKPQQELLTNTIKQVDYQADTAKYQTSTMDQLGTIAEILMNEIYGVMTFIWDALLELMDMPLFGNTTKSSIGRAEKANVGRDKELTQILSTAKNSESLQYAGVEAADKVSGRAQEALKAALAERDQLKERLATTKDEGEKKAISERIAQLDPAEEMRRYAEMSLEDLKGEITAANFSSEGTASAIKILSDMLGAGGGRSGAALAAKIPGAPAAATATAPTAAAAAATVNAAEAAPTAEQQQATTTSVDNLNRSVALDGVKLSPSTVTGPLSDAMAKSVYEGTSKALFEFFMYSGRSRSDVAQSVARGVPISGLGPESMSRTLGTGSNPLTSPPHAMGGTVTGIRGGMAQVARFPAAGEGWASVGRGEQIIPAGGGRGGGGSVRVELELKGDLKRFIQARVVEGASAHDRNRRLR